MASARSPMLSASSNWLSGSIAAQTQCGARERRCPASASLTSPSFTALSSAKSSSSWTWVTRTSYRKEREKAAACSATSTTQARTVLGSTANTRARSEEHTSELQSLAYLVCRLLLEKKKTCPASTHFAS